jgi:hypothetical protein
MESGVSEDAVSGDGHLTLEDGAEVTVAMERSKEEKGE